MALIKLSSVTLCLCFVDVNQGSLVFNREKTKVGAYIYFFSYILSDKYFLGVYFVFISSCLI